MTTTSSTSTFSDFAAQWRELIRRTDSAGFHADDNEFNRLALSLFELQFSHNAPYRRFCLGRKAEPRTVRHWSEIPAMPTVGFKEFELTSLPPEQRTAVFHSSGTTEQRPSRHFHSADSMSIYEASLVRWFQSHFPASPAENCFWLFLTPSSERAPHSSLVHMFDTLRRESAGEDASFTGLVQSDGSWDMDWQATLNALRAAFADNRPVMIFGTAFNFVHLLDHLEQGGKTFRLPASSRVLETGGYKGRSRSLPKAELHALITKRLGIPAGHIACEYGMSELSSQAYDSVAGQARVDARVFHFPPWARAQIVSPETGRAVSEGETGLIRIFDLANVYSVMAIQTEDLGVWRGSGFELLGRAALSEPRGCSLMSL